MNGLVDETVVQCIKNLGYEKPKEFQIDVVREFVGGRDVFSSVPTALAVGKAVSGLQCQYIYVCGESLRLLIILKSKVGMCLKSTKVTDNQHTHNISLS